MKSRHLVAKDILLMIRDRYALLLLIGMPLSITGIVCMAAIEFSDSTRPESLRIAVLDLDDSQSSQELLRAIETSPGHVRRVQADELRDLVDHRGWSAGVIIGPEFGTRVEAVEFVDLLDLPHGRLSRGLAGFDLQILNRDLKRLEALAVSQFVFAKLLETVYSRAVNRSPFFRAYLDANRHRLQSSSEPSALQSLAGLRVTHEEVYRIIIPSQAVLFAFFLVNVMARSFVGERVRGTLQRVRMTPISPLSLLVGKTVPFLIVSVIQGVLLFASAGLVFGMPFGGSLSMLFGVILCTSLAATGLGLLIAVSVGSDYQVNVLATFLVLVMAGISGCLMPRDLMPQFMQSLSQWLTPHAWSLNAYEELLSARPADPWRVADCCFRLLAFAAGFALLSLWRMSKPDPILTR